MCNLLEMLSLESLHKINAIALNVYVSLMLLETRVGYMELITQVVKRYQMIRTKKWSIVVIINMDFINYF